MTNDADNSALDSNIFTVTPVQHQLDTTTYDVHTVLNQAALTINTSDPTVKGVYSIRVTIYNADLSANLAEVLTVTIEEPCITSTITSNFA